MGLSSFHNPSPKPESRNKSPGLFQKKKRLEQEGQTPEKTRLEKKKNIFSRTIVEETDLKSDILKSGNGDVREKSTHRKLFNF